MVKDNRKGTIIITKELINLDLKNRVSLNFQGILIKAASKMIIFKEKVC